MTTLQAGRATDSGRIRSHNEDALLVAPEVSLFAVADGMGGHQGGEVASAIAIETLQNRITEPDRDALIDAVHEANATVFERGSANDELRGMGTTLCAIALIPTTTVGDEPDEELAWINVGDSRIYLYRDDELIQLSADHSLVEDLRRDGQLSDDDAAIHPRRNILTRALGIDREVQIDVDSVVPYAGDRYLLCSDGLSNEVTEDAIAATMRRLAEPEEVAQDLVRQANEGGGRDNITCVVVDVVDDGGRSEAASAALAAAAATKAADEEARSEQAASENDEAATALVDDDATRVHAAIGDGAGGGRPSEGTDGSDDDDLPFGRDSDSLYDDLSKARAKHITWRVLAFVLAVVIVLGVAGGAIGWYAKRTYYVDFAGDRVAIYQGQPGGLLMFDPTIDQRVDVSRSDLRPEEVERIEAQEQFSSLPDARTFANRLVNEVRDREEQTSSTTTTEPGATSEPGGTSEPFGPTTSAPDPTTTSQPG